MAAQRRLKFAERVRSWPASWFISAQSGGNARVWYMSDLFINRVLAFIDEVIAAAGKHARKTYFPAD